MIRKFLFLTLTFLLFSSCGYSPIYSSNNLNFSINNIEKENNLLNNRFAEIIKGIGDENSSNRINIIIESEKKVEIKSKDTKGNPLIYELKIILKIKIMDPLNQKEKEFIENTSFNNNDDKFELSNYQKELEETLIRKLVERTIVYLSSL
tara:strand:- start:1 stop:450 length:450 start_codon:yes stop_codon:yes gene_type:complete